MLLWLLIVPASLIPNTTSSVCTCYIFTGNSGERQRQTWIVGVTCSERSTSVCFAWECEVYSKQRPMRAQSLVITPAVKRITQSIAKRKTATHCSSYTDLHVISSHLTCHPIWKCGCDKSLTGMHLFTTTACCNARKYGRTFTSRFRCSKIMPSNLKF